MYKWLYCLFKSFRRQTPLLEKYVNFIPVKIGHCERDFMGLVAARKMFNIKIIIIY